MALPQWKEPGPSMQYAWGLDTSTVPAWFNIRQGEWKSLYLENAADMLVTSTNERVVTVRDQGPVGAARDIEIHGKLAMPFPVRIEVRNKITRRIVSVLDVNVKHRRTVGVNFHFVEDRAGDKTVQSTAVADTLVARLNSIFDAQTCIRFQVRNAADVKVNIDLDDVVLERKTPNGDVSPDSIIAGKQTWRGIFSKHSRPDGLNFYFVPSDDPQRNRNAVPYYDHNGATDNCVIEDGGEPLEKIVPHAVGRLLLQEITTKAEKQHHLMYFNATLRRTGDFIPRPLANQMNP